MINIGLIGYGRWGKILYQKLIKFCNVKFVCSRGDKFVHLLKSVDWVVVATPNDSHYEIVKKCLKAGNNVFCEKPLSESYNESKELFEIAEENNLRLYVDDIQTYRKSEFNFGNDNFVERRKYSDMSLKEVFFNLFYHDVYILYDYLFDKTITNIVNLSEKGKLIFLIEWDNIKVKFLYDITSQKKTHKINGISQNGEDDILSEMLRMAISEKVDYAMNKELALYSTKITNHVKNYLIKKVAIIGGGIFGCTTAWYLSKNGFEVDLFEKNNDILLQASGINQYRLHSGYHYPRSRSTALSSLNGISSFIQEYGSCIVPNTEHFYCISKKDSLVTGNQYTTFLDDVNLSYKKITNLDILKKENLDLIIEAQESLFDPLKLRKLVWDKLKKYNVNVILNSEVSNNIGEEYDYLIFATYSNINSLLSDKYFEKQKDYQFELCEKPVFKLPPEFKNKSVVIMDGPFMCLDPFSDTGNHVGGNVVHAIHRTNIGKIPDIPYSFGKLMNKGIIKNPEISKKRFFLNSMKRFFKNVDDFKYLGSMFTVRSVLPNRDKDDSRPTILEALDKKTFSLFSGKIGTCVDAASDLWAQLKS